MRRRWVPVMMVLAPCAWGLDFFSSEGRSTRGPEILNRGVGARATALGRAGTTMTEGAEAAFWNPAGISFTDRSDLYLSHESGLFNERLDSIAYVRPAWWNGARRTVGVGLRLLSQRSFDIVEDAKVLGRARPQEMAGSLLYAQPWGRGSLGIDVYGVRQQYFSSRTQTAGISVGYRTQSPRWRAGAVVSHIGPPVRGEGQRVGQPLALKGSAAFNLFSHPTKDLWLIGQTDLPTDDSIIPRVGAEYVFPLSREWNAALRSGYQMGGSGQGISGGVGLQKDPWGVDLALHLDRSLGETFHCDLRRRFGRPLPRESARNVKVELARRQVDSGQLLGARDTVDDLLTIAPRDPEVRELDSMLERRFNESLDPQTLFLQGYHASRSGSYDKAVDFLEKLLLVLPSHQDGKKLLDECRSKLNEERERRLRAELAEGKKQASAMLLNRAAAAEKKGRWADALSFWLQLVKTDPTSPPSRAGIERCRLALLDLADQAETSGRYGEALDWAEKAALAGDKGPSMDQRLRRLKQQIDAIESSTSEAGENEKKRQAEKLFEEGVEAYSAGRWAQAERLFSSGLKMDPGHRGLLRAMDRIKAERSSR